MSFSLLKRFWDGGRGLISHHSAAILRNIYIFHFQYTFFGVCTSTLSSIVAWQLFSNRLQEAKRVRPCLNQILLPQYTFFSYAYVIVRVISCHHNAKWKWIKFPMLLCLCRVLTLVVKLFLWITPTERSTVLQETRTAVIELVLMNSAAKNPYSIGVLGCVLLRMRTNWPTAAKGSLIPLRAQKRQSTEPKTFYSFKMSSPPSMKRDNTMAVTAQVRTEEDAPFPLEVSQRTSAKKRRAFFARCKLRSC